MHMVKTTSPTGAQVIYFHISNVVIMLVVYNSTATIQISRPTLFSSLHGHRALLSPSLYASNLPGFVSNLTHCTTVLSFPPCHVLSIGLPPCPTLSSLSFSLALSVSLSLSLSLLTLTPTLSPSSPFLADTWR